MAESWSKSNVVGLRQRWGSVGSALDRAGGLRGGAEANGGNGGVSGSIKREFLARAIVIDCSHADCGGKLLTGKREFNDPGDVASTVVLRCTRQPREHAQRISIAPFTVGELEALASERRRGRRLTCLRCGTALVLRSSGQDDAWAESSAVGQRYRCPWCGVQGRLPGESPAGADAPSS